MYFLFFHKFRDSAIFIEQGYYLASNTVSLVFIILFILIFSELHICSFKNGSSKAIINFTSNMVSLDMCSLIKN